MSGEFTALQQRMLRMLVEGPQHKIEFDGRTILSMLARDFIVVSVNSGMLSITTAGRQVAQSHADQRRPISATAVQPMMREIPPPPADGMAEVCCSGFEAAVAAGVMQIDSHGKAYIRHGSARWYTARCPWCPEVIE